MIVNKYKFVKSNKLDSNGFNINLSINNEFDLTGKEDSIVNDFIKLEVDNAINDIFDYEKIKFTPKDNNGDLVSGILYKLNILDDDGNYLINTYWSDMEIEYNDFKYRKNSFVKSFLRLDFYDSDIVTRQRLLFFITIFPKFNVSDYLSDGTIPLPSNYDLSFRLGNPLVDNEADGEGFGLYFFKDEVLPTVPKKLYMKASFSNAKNGKVTRFMSTNNPEITIDNLIVGGNDNNNLHTRYVLNREEEGYYYSIDETYSENITDINNNYTINLYEISSS